MRLLSLLALTLAAAPPLSAQWDSTTAFGRVLQRRFAEIDVPDSKSGPLVQWMPDSTVIGYARFSIEFFRLVSPRECFLAFAAPEGAADLFRLLQQRSDSSHAEGLAGYIVLGARNLAQREPAYPVASVKDVRRVMRGLISHGSTKERRFIRKQVVSPPGKTCVLAPWLYRRLVGKSARIAPVLRNMLAP